MLRPIQMATNHPSSTGPAPGLRGLSVSFVMVATLAGLPLSEPMLYCQLVVLVRVPRRRRAGRPADRFPRLHDAAEHFRDFTAGRVSVDMSSVAVGVLPDTFRLRPVRAIELPHGTVALGLEMA